ncbi:MAG: ATP synthase F1 subunit delta [Firmicutes bacterium]|nr:ATP synthase F1 subunit delta [Bacillota bacterium]
MSINVVAQRYANAFYTCVENGGTLDAAYEDMGKLNAALAKKSMLKQLLGHPGISRADKKAAVDAEFQKLGIWTKRLLYYLIDEGRTALIDDIISWFRQRYLAEQRIAEIEVTTAVALEESAFERLLADLEEKFGKRVMARTVVDPSIIGGLVIRHGGRVYDGSVRTTLQEINRRLGGGIAT